jgi:pantoate--beta-alanine ligase
MQIIHKLSDMESLIRKIKESGESIGFVPTMGALHEGHLSLIQAARKENSWVICSIFVNPKQFNETADFSNYPKTPEKDAAMLNNENTDVLFMPDQSEIYHSSQNIAHLELGAIGNTMEGKSRPGHFAGVVAIVDILFQLIQPNKAYFGKKDYQQLRIVKLLAEKLHPNIQVIGVDTSRENNGLARSSRNLLLSEAARNKAAVIYQSLHQAKKLWEDGQEKQTIEAVVHKLIHEQGLSLIYFEIADALTLQSLNKKGGKESAVGFIAAKIEGVRLIDNLEFN